MAKQVKKNEPKQETAKKKKTVKNNEQKSIEEKIAEMENTNDVQDVSKIEINLDEISNSLNSVSTDLDTTMIEEEIEKKVQDTFDELKETTAKINDFEESKKIFNEKIEKEPENAQKIIENEIKRTQMLKTEAEKIINSKKVTNTKHITSWWNGIGYDM